MNFASATTSPLVTRRTRALRIMLIVSRLRLCHVFACFGCSVVPRTLTVIKHSWQCLARLVPVRRPELAFRKLNVCLLELE
jgi:hypothetical protein